MVGGGHGVALKLCCQLVRRSVKNIATEPLLKIAAIGTVADVAPLIGENRTIAWLGLNGLADPRNRGLRALIRRLGMLGRPLRAVDIGFRIGPRINAAGRLASAETAIDLFSAETDEAAWNLCAELDRMKQLVAEAVELGTYGGGGRLRVMLPSCWESNPQTPETQQPCARSRGDQWHKGVIGLAAGRIAQKYHRPTLVISIDGETAVGSARSIPTIDLHAQLESIADVFTHFGDTSSRRLLLETTRIPELRRRLAESFDRLDEQLFRRDAKIDDALTFAEIDRPFLDAHELLQPFGAGNPQPLFLARNVRVAGRREFGEGCCELSLEDATGRAAAVVWPSVRELDPIFSNGGLIDVVFQVEPDSPPLRECVRRSSMRGIP